LGAEDFLAAFLTIFLGAEAFFATVFGVAGRTFFELETVLFEGRTVFEAITVVGGAGRIFAILLGAFLVVIFLEAFLVEVFLAVLVEVFLAVDMVFRLS
jgi:hypothetical protein